MIDTNRCTFHPNSALVIAVQQLNSTLNAREDSNLKEEKTEFTVEK